MIRPEVLAGLKRWREVIAALALTGFGLWILSWGGLFYGILGGIGLAVGLSLALSAWRRLRFAQSGGGVGVVEVDEGEIRYFGPYVGGQIARPDLARIDLVSLGTSRAWRLVTADGQALAIPTDAQGVEALFDVIVALPDAQPEAFLAALGAPLAEPGRTVWRRASAHRSGAVTHP